MSSFLLCSQFTLPSESFLKDIGSKIRETFIGNLNLL